jgi:outer membrane protein assembly factor BamA
MRELEVLTSLAAPRVNRACLVVGSFVALLAVGCARPRPAASTSPPRPVAAKPSFEELVIHGYVHVGTQTLTRLKLRFFGAAHVKATELAKDFALLKYRDLESDVLERDALWVTAWYYDHGYLEVNVTHEAEVDGTEAIVTYRVREGSQYKLRGLDVVEAIDGKLYPPIGWKAPLGKGDVFSRTAMAEALAAMRTAYADLGYAYVEADPESTLDLEKHEVSLVVRVVRGKLQFLEDVNIVGNKKIATEVLRQELLVKPMDRYNETALLQSKQKLLDTGWFVRVDVSTKKGTNADRTIVTFEVEETRPGTALHMASA